MTQTRVMRTLYVILIIFRGIIPVKYGFLQKKIPNVSITIIDKF